ncbi:MAG: guanylate kinase [Clostridiales bacterium]|nr:guanylate kinase [Clostridiales bacterium]
MKRKGNLIVISGPSGTGKGTIVKQILEKDDNLVISVSATTRSPRTGEQNGKDYHFINKDDFKTMIENDGLLEYAEYCDNFYGTPKSVVEKALNNGNDVILEIEVQGAQKIREKCPDSVSIFVAPPSMQELRARLKNRSTESDEVIDKRTAQAAVELKCAGDYNYIVVNDRLEKCVLDVLSIINAERYKTDRMSSFINELSQN